jgi:hypothetical protein
MWDFGKFGLVYEYMDSWYYQYRGTSRWTTKHSAMARLISFNKHESLRYPDS